MSSWKALASLAILSGSRNATMTMISDTDKMIERAGVLRLLSLARAAGTSPSVAMAIG